MSVRGTDRSGGWPRPPAAGDPRTASGLTAYLAAGGALAALDPDTLGGLRLHPGETAYADIPAHADRFTGPASQPASTSGGLLILGPLRWMAAGLLLNAMLARRARRRAATAAAPTWLQAGPVRLVLTDTCTLIGFETGWQQLRHADILHIQPDPHNDCLVLAPGDDSPPLRLAGSHVPAYTAALTWLLHTTN